MSYFGCWEQLESAQAECVLHCKESCRAAERAEKRSRKVDRVWEQTAANARVLQTQIALLEEARLQAAEFLEQALSSWLPSKIPIPISIPSPSSPRFLYMDMRS